EPMAVDGERRQIHRGRQAGQRDASRANRRRDRHNHHPARRISPQAKQNQTGQKRNQHKAENERHKYSPSRRRPESLPLAPDLPSASALMLLSISYVIVSIN